MSTKFGVPSSFLAATPLPDGYDDFAVYLRQFILNCQLAVSANDIRRHRQLRGAIQKYVRTEFGRALGALIDEATDSLYERLCAVPDSEIEEDDADPLDFNLPGPEDNE